MITDTIVVASKTIPTQCSNGRASINKFSISLFTSRSCERVRIKKKKIQVDIKVEFQAHPLTWDIDLVLFVSGVAESSDGRLTLPT